MSEEVVENAANKRPRGKPKGFRAPDARRKDQKIRWKESEYMLIQLAAELTTEDDAEFVRHAALYRAKKILEDDVDITDNA